MTIRFKGRIASRLHEVACNEIAGSHVDALNEITTGRLPSSQHESKFVAHLCRAMAGVAKAWKNELSVASTGHSLSMATVFTHQSPYVKWNAGTAIKRCELADILFARIDRTSNNPKGVAMLVQAKVSTSSSVTLSSRSEKNQFDLFSARPNFDVDAPLATRGINLRGLSPDAALMYGLTGPTAAALPNHFAWPHHWLTANDLGRSAGTYAVTGEDCLAYTLVGMLMGNVGWDFVLPPVGGGWRSLASANPRDDWATLINYLLAQTFTKPLSIAQRISMGRLQRGQEDVVQLATTNHVGQQMFFIGHDLTDSTTMQYFAGDGATDTNDWQVKSPNDGPAPGGDGGSIDVGEQFLADEPPEGGPVSAILFEVGD